MVLIWDTVDEQEQTSVRHGLWLCTYNSIFNHITKKKITLLLSSTNTFLQCLDVADKTDTRELFASPEE